MQTSDTHIDQAAGHMRLKQGWRSASTPWTRLKSLLNVKWQCFTSQRIFSTLKLDTAHKVFRPMMMYQVYHMYNVLNIYHIMYTFLLEWLNVTLFCTYSLKVNTESHMTCHMGTYANPDVCLLRYSNRNKARGMFRAGLFVFYYCHNTSYEYDLWAHATTKCFVAIENIDTSCCFVFMSF